MYCIPILSLASPKSDFTTELDYVVKSVLRGNSSVRILNHRATTDDVKLSTLRVSQKQNCSRVADAEQELEDAYRVVNRRRNDDACPYTPIASHPAAVYWHLLGCRSWGLL